MSFHSESFSTEQAQAAITSEHWDHLKSVASAYRLLILLFLLRIFGYVITQATQLPSTIQWPLSLVFAGVLAAAAYRLATLLRARLPLLWAVAMFLPLLNLLSLFFLSRQGTRFFQERGVRVGFFGPSTTALEKAEAEALQAPLPSAIVH